MTDLWETPLEILIHLIWGGVWRCLFLKVSPSVFLMCEPGWEPLDKERSQSFMIPSSSLKDLNDFPLLLRERFTLWTFPKLWLREWWSPLYIPSPVSSSFLKKYSFFWLPWVLVAACGIFCCCMQGLVSWPGIEPGPLHWELRVLDTGPPGKSLCSLFWCHPYLLCPHLSPLYVSPPASMTFAFFPLPWIYFSLLLLQWTPVHPAYLSPTTISSGRLLLIFPVPTTHTHTHTHTGSSWWSLGVWCGPQSPSKSESLFCVFLAISGSSKIFWLFLNLADHQNDEESLLLFVFWSYRTACGILVPRLGIEPMLSAVEAHSLNPWTNWEILRRTFLK